MIRNFEVIGEATKNLPGDLRARYPAIEWRQVAGFRDIIAHGYFRIDYEILWGIVTEKVPVLKKRDRRDPPGREEAGERAPVVFF